MRGAMIQPNEFMCFTFCFLKSRQLNRKQWNPSGSNCVRSLQKERCVCLSGGKTESSSDLGASRKRQKDLALKTLWSQGFCGLRWGGPGQTMLSDRYPGGVKEEETNNEREKAAVSKQMVFQGSWYVDRPSKKHKNGCEADDPPLLGVEWKCVRTKLTFS